MKKILLRVIQEVKNIQYELRSRFSHVSESVTNSVPFVCQFSRPEQAEPTLRKKLATIDDPYWQDTGAATPARYARWAFSMCGMASALMAIQFFKKDSTIKVVELAEDAFRQGLYVEEPTCMSDMKYREFATWIPRYGLTAEVYTSLSVRGIQHAFTRGKLVMVSVNPNIRGYDTAPVGQKGGHLVLVVGYDKKNTTISINNPSGFASSNTQIGHTLSVPDFLRYYAGRGIVLSALE